MTLSAVDYPPRPRQLQVRPWVDPVLDQHGHDPRGAYAETFWLPLLGPSATLLARRFAAGLELQPGGYSLTADDAARMLGLGARSGKRSPFNRTLSRLSQFRLVHVDAEDVLLARRRLPGLTRTQIMKLPAALRDAHAAWRAAEVATPALPVLRERARTLALTLLQLGEAPDDVEAHLCRLRFHPALCRQSIAWASTQLPPPTTSGVQQGDRTDPAVHTRRSR